MDVVHTIEGGSWDGPFAPTETESAVAALESGMVIRFPHLPFVLVAGELGLLSPSLSDGRAKNISMDLSGRLKHAAGGRQTRTRLAAMMARFAESSERLVRALFPTYRGKLERARTSFRPVEIEGRRTSSLRDDTRLHVDAFPTTPMRGRRILRVFANVHPDGRPRVWHVGENFATMARRFVPGLREPVPIKNWFLAGVGATRGPRSVYDDIMLGLHDAAKLDLVYQQSCTKTRIAFAPGSTWLCFSDQVMHAALSGQYALEQTFYLGIDAMASPEKSPLRVLEAMLKRTLV